MKSCPIEYEEEVSFCEYCDRRGFTHWHVPQETYTDSWKQKAKNKAQGVLEGVSDHWVILPTEKWGVILLVIEFKRQFGNTPTPAQIDFIHKIDQVDNVLPFCAYGCQEAVDVIEELEQGIDQQTLRVCEQRLEKIHESRQKRQKTAKNTQNVAKKKNDRDDLPPAENDLPY